MKVRKFIIPKTNWGIRYSAEPSSTIAWKGYFVIGIKFLPKVEYNIFVRINRRVIAVGYHRYWGKMHS